jgi:hypothetical protein
MGVRGVLAHIALAPLTTEVVGIASLTLIKAQAKVQGTANPLSVNITAGTLMLN